MPINALQTRLDASLALRAVLGDATQASSRLLQDLVASLAPHGDGPPSRAHLAVDGAGRASAPRGPAGPHARLRAARGLLIHRHARLPETEVPERTLPAAPRRPHPSRFAATDLSRMRDEAGRMGP